MITKESLEGAGLRAGCYKASNLWNPSDNTNLKNFSSMQAELDDEQILVLLLQPKELAIYCDVATAEH